MAELGTSKGAGVGKGISYPPVTVMGFLMLFITASPVQAEIQHQQSAVIEGEVVRDYAPAPESRVTVGSYAPPPSIGTAGDDGRSAAGGILIWLENNDSSMVYTDPTEELPVLNQADKKFEPRLLAVRTGGSVRILNSDPLYHNVFSLSGPNKFDVGHRTPGEYHDEQFDNEGVVDVFCDLHSDMHAVIRVLPRRTVSWQLLSDSGGYRFENIEPGEYTLHYYAIGSRQEGLNVQVIEPGTIMRETVRLRAE